jgi:hypothetical protein
MISVPPPVEYGTITRTVFVGYVCATTGAAAAPVISAKIDQRETR